MTITKFDRQTARMVSERIEAALGVKPTEVYDLYFCKKGTPGLRSTVIARCGDEGHEYKSGTIFATTGADEELALAYKLARAVGLLPGVKP
jgi:aspartate/methionine/tyrosine aminotransferase